MGPPSNGFCAVTGTGDLWCWGNGYFIPGFGPSDDQLEPVKIEAPGRVVDVSVSQVGLCVLVSTGEVYCTDSVEPWSSLDGNPLVDDEWIRIPDLNNVDVLRNNCAIEDGRALCWGPYVFETWDKTPSDISSSFALSRFFPLRELSDISVSVEATVAVTTDGRVWVFPRDSASVAPVELPCDVTTDPALKLSRIVDTAWDWTFISEDGVLVGPGKLDKCEYTVAGIEVSYGCPAESFILLGAGLPRTSGSLSADADTIFRSDIDSAATLAARECDGPGCECATRPSICVEPPDACF